MGEKNVANIYFGLEKGKHVGICNVQCLNATVYKTWSKKNANILGKYVEFIPHPQSLDGANKPSDEELKKLGFEDVNTAMANTIATIENGPRTGFTKEDVNKMVEQAVNKGVSSTLTEVRKEMAIMKEEIVQEARVYADVVQAQASASMLGELQRLRNQLMLTTEFIEKASKTPALPSNETMDMSN